MELSAALTDGLERNRTYIVDCSIRFGILAAGFVFLRACVWTGTSLASLPR